MSNSTRSIGMALWFAGTAAVGMSGCDTAEPTGESDVRYRANDDGDDPDARWFCENYDGDLVSFGSVQFSDTSGRAYITADGINNVTYQRVHEIPGLEDKRRWWRVECHDDDESARFRNEFTSRYLFADYGRDSGDGKVVQAAGGTETSAQYFEVQPDYGSGSCPTGRWTMLSKPSAAQWYWVYTQWGGQVKLGTTRPSGGAELFTISTGGVTAVE